MIELYVATFLEDEMKELKGSVIFLNESLPANEQVADVIAQIAEEKNLFNSSNIVALLLFCLCPEWRNPCRTQTIQSSNQATLWEHL